jgi:hypothetical protein
MNNSYSTLPNWLASLEGKTDMELETRKRELQFRGRDDPAGNTIEELEEIIAIINKLRSGRPGPPKHKTARPARVDLTAGEIDF